MKCRRMDVEAYANEIGRPSNPHRGVKFEVTTVRDAGLAALHQAVNAYARIVSSLSSLQECERT
jgi:hypothetical protein